MSDVLTAIIELRAGSYFAGLSHLPEAAQLTAVRRVMLSDVDRLEAELLAQVELVRDCLLMAANSMQDARLALLEQELAKVQNPTGRQWGEYIVEAVLILAMELGVVFLPYLGAPLIAPLIGSMMLSRTAAAAGVRRELRSVAEKRLLADAQTTAILDRAEQLFDRWQAEEVARAAVQREFASLKASDAREQVDRRLSDLIVHHGTISQLEGQQRELQHQLRTLAEAERPALVRAAEAFVTNDMNAESPIAKLGGKVRATSDSRVGQTLGTMLNEAMKPSSTPPPTSTAVFSTSDVLGRTLEACRERGVQIRLSMADLREAIVDVTWDELLEEPAWSQRVVDLCTVPAWLAAHRGAAGLPQTALVCSAEAVLWYEWLTVSGALRREVGRTYTHTVPQRAWTLSAALPAGSAHGPYWIVAPTGGKRSVLTEAGQLWLKQDHAAWYCPGLVMLSEGQSAYLYERFARVLAPELTGLPFALGDTDFSKISTLDPKNFWGGTNEERAQLVARQKLVVIMAFEQIGARISQLPTTVALQGRGYSATDLEIPLTVLEEADDLDEALEHPSTSEAWTTLRSDAMLAVEALRNATTLDEMLWTQIDAMPTEPASARQAFERQRAALAPQIAQSKAKIADALKQAAAQGSTEQLLLELEAAAKPSTLQALREWTSRPTKPRWSTTTGPFDSVPN